MNQLSFTEAYVLCIVSQNEKESALYASEYEACILSAAIWELLKSGALAQDENKKLVVKGLPESDKAYLLDLQEHIADLKPQTAMRLVEHYIFGLSTKRTKTFIGHILDDLVEGGHLEVETHKGLIKEKHKYHVKQEQVQEIIDELKKHLLDDQGTDEESLILAALLYESKLLEEFFSKFELERLKSRIQEIKESREGQFIKEILDDIEAMMVAIMVATNSGMY